jgi:enoyl-CoA hydratase
MTFETIAVETRGRVGWITLDRPRVLNALDSALMREVVEAAEAFDADPAIGAIVVTGSERAFAAGADITEMEQKSAAEMLEHFAPWSRFAAVETPVVAAVAGYALGGGCELAMMCDIIVAADTAKFGQPEVNLAVIPGIGGTQRLVRALGYYKAADLILTGRMLDAAEAERSGLVSRVVPADELLAEAGRIADTMAAKSGHALSAAKRALAAALETSLTDGLRRETEVFAALFGTPDQREGMSAFREKRDPDYAGR